MNNKALKSRNANRARPRASEYQDPRVATVPVSRPRDGVTKRAKVLDTEPLERVFQYIDLTSRTPEINRLKVLLSFKAGLRVSEIAQLMLEDVTEADGRLGRYIRVPAGISKGGRGRDIPMHPDIARAIKAFRARYPDLDRFGITHVHSSIRIQSVNALTSWFHRLYELVGLTGCSSHSGRRTFITRLAQRANEYNNSLRDVQVLAGHARLDTTECYIEPSSNMHDLVNSLGHATRHEQSQKLTSNRRSGSKKGESK